MPNPTPTRAGAPFLATDIGGTHARMALVRRDAAGDIELLDHHKYICAEYPGLAAIVADFLGARGQRVDDAAVASTGLHRGEEVISINLPWPVSLAELRALGIARVAAVNDFVAVAHADQCMRDGCGTALREVAGPVPPGPEAVIGPGTGLGAAIRVPLGSDGVLVLPSEAGQQAFAPGNAREMAALAKMRETAAYVPTEHFVSGPGLLKTYRALCALDGVSPRHAGPAEVAEAAGRGDDAQARGALRMFCDVLGAALGDFVLASGATRVWVAGGILPKLRGFVADSDFEARFLEKGTMRKVLEQVPVRLVDDPQLGIIGAANWYLRRRAA